MSKLGIFLSFVAGAVAGSLVTYKVVTDRYYAILEDEEDVYYDEDEESEDDEDDSQVKYGDKPDLMEYAAKLKENGYIKEEDTMSIPYVISPEEFDTMDYETASLTYYADGVLTSENDVPIPEDEIEDCVGPDALTSFGQYEEDSVFVRDDGIKMDIEILRDNRNYHDLFPEED